MRDLLLQSITIFFLVQDGQRRQRRRNLFVDEQILPPLKPIENTKVDGPSSRYSNRTPVLYTNDPEAVTEWIDQNICNRPMVVGWDTESSPNLPWRRNTKYIGPSTVQLSTVDATMVLEIANEIEGGHPDSLLPLKGILADASILKAGVGIDDDMLELHRWDDDVAEEVFGRFDIGGIGSSKGRSASLKTLAKVILGLELPKSKKIAMSNWAKAPLSKTQIQYAARDAWVAAAVMDELCRLDPSLFATMSVLESMRQYNDSNEQSMTTLDQRSTQRKKIKLKRLEILTKDDKKVPRSHLSEDELIRVEALEEQMKELAPPQRIVFNVTHLGLSIWND